MSFAYGLIVANIDKPYFFIGKHNRLIFVCL